MKLTAVTVSLAVLQVHAGTGLSQPPAISLSLDRVPIVKFFEAVESQTGYRFVWTDEQLKDAKPVTVHVNGRELPEVLGEVFKEQPVSYRVNEDRKLIIVDDKAPVKKSADVGPGPADPGRETIVVKGKVFSELGEPLAGASIMIKGTRKGVETNADGSFEFNGIDPNAELVVSYTGYVEEVIKLEGRRSLDLSLKHSTSELDATVIKGYYSTTERMNTGDISSVTGKEISEQPVTDPLQALEGRVPGLYISQTSGIPGAYANVYLMGKNSIFNGNDPLYIVDGVPYSSTSLTSPDIGGGPVGFPTATPYNTYGAGLSPFNNLDPSDIESIEVLKDADATAIYGSRGANGVILITTKKGRAGHTKINATVYSGSSAVTRMMSLLNTPEYLQLRNEALKNDGISAYQDYDFDLTYWDTTRYTNWQKVLIGNPSHFTNAQISVSGGSAATQFVIGGSYNSQGTVYPGDYGDKKVSGNVSLNHSAADNKLKLMFSATYVNDDNDLPQSDLTSFVMLAPDAPSLFNGDGSLNWQPFGGTPTWTNPLAFTKKQYGATTQNFISNLGVSYEILHGLIFKVNSGFTHAEMIQNQIQPSASVPPPYNGNPLLRQLTSATSYSQTWVAEPQLNYSKKIRSGEFNVLFGGTLEENLMSSQSDVAFGFASDALILNPGAASNFQLVGSENSIYHYAGAYGRLGYNLFDRYLVNITARRDGSSRFGVGKQFGDFGAIGLGWIFSKERFMGQGVGALSFGKIRMSLGTTGNDQIPPYQYLSSYSPVSYSYQGIVGLGPSRIANPNYSWEVVKKFEVALDLGFFKDRLLVSATYYRNRDGNQLIGYPLPAVTGFSSVEENLPALVQNSGVELTGRAIIIKNRKFSWSTWANFTFPENKLVSYPGLSTSSFAHAYAIGKSLFVRYAYHYTGVDPTTGIYTFATKNANGVPSYPQDLVVTKPITQQGYGGIGNDLTYQGFELSFFVEVVKQRGTDIWANVQSVPGNFGTNLPNVALARWTRPGVVTNIQQMDDYWNSNVYNAFFNFQGSDGVIGNASFIRLKNVSLSWALPKSCSRACHLDALRLFVQGQNIWTFTKFLGLDPETEGLNLPPLRTVTGGIQVNL